MFPNNLAFDEILMICLSFEQILAVNKVSAVSKLSSNDIWQEECNFENYRGKCQTLCMKQEL